MSGEHIKKLTDAGKDALEKHRKHDVSKGLGELPKTKILIVEGVKYHTVDIPKIERR